MAAGFKVVIPARYGSTRLPGKPLLPLAGKPMVGHVCARALASGAQEVIVATDDSRIFDAVRAFGIPAVMTRPDHPSGTERIAEVAELRGWLDDEIIVNVQGDEPLIPPALISDLAETLTSQEQANIATLAAKIVDEAEVFNPNAVKVVLDRAGYALYFSRAPIPWYRDGFIKEPKQIPGNLPYLRHIGLYAYRVGFLRRYCGWPPSSLEGIESLEQLRILWQGEKIKVKVVAETPQAGVDTEADLRRIDALLKGQVGLG